MAKQYPNVGEITTVKPQGLCQLCGEIELDGERPNKRIVIQHDWFRGNDTVHKAHGECAKRMPKSELLRSLTL